MLLLQRRAGLAEGCKGARMCAGGDLTRPRRSGSRAVPISRANVVSLEHA